MDEGYLVRAQNLGISQWTINIAEQQGQLQALVDQVEANEPQPSRHEEVLTEMKSLFDELDQTRNLEAATERSLASGVRQIQQLIGKLTAAVGQLEQQRDKLLQKREQCEDRLHGSDGLAEGSASILELWATRPAVIRKEPDAVRSSLEAQAAQAQHTYTEYSRLIESLSGEIEKVNAMRLQVLKEIAIKAEGLHVDEMVLKVAIKQSLVAPADHQSTAGVDETAWQQVTEQLLVQAAACVAHVPSVLEPVAPAALKCTQLEIRIAKPVVEALIGARAELNEMLTHQPLLIESVQQQADQLEPLIDQFEPRIVKVQQQLARSQQRLATRNNRPKSEAKVDKAEACLVAEQLKFQEIHAKLLQQRQQVIEEVAKLRQKKKWLIPDLEQARLASVICADCLEMEFRISRIKNGSGPNRDLYRKRVIQRFKQTSPSRILAPSVEEAS